MARRPPALPPALRADVLLLAQSGREVLRHDHDQAHSKGRFDSVQELVEAINDYLRVKNKDPKPFKWTASTEAIIEKVNRCR